MMHTLQRIDPLSAAKVVGVSAALVSAIYAVIGIAVATITGMQLEMTEGPFAGASIWLLLLVPVGYLIGVFIMTFIVCVIFNAVAGWLGGISIELTAD